MNRDRKPDERKLELAAHILIDETKENVLSQQVFLKYALTRNTVKDFDFQFAFDVSRILRSCNAGDVEQ